MTKFGRLMLWMSRVALGAVLLAVALGDMQGALAMASCSVMFDLLSEWHERACQ